MDQTTAVSLVVALVGAAVALFTWATSQIATLVGARREARRQLVARVLDVVDALVKQQAAPVFWVMWNRREIDMTLLQTRLALEMRPRDQVIAQWVWAQTQRLVSAADEKEVTRIAVSVGAALAFWHQGKLKRRWFSGELEKEPVLKSFSVPRAARNRLTSRIFKETLGGAVIGSAIIALISQVRALAR